jgi:hypothetical protein
LLVRVFAKLLERLMFSNASKASESNHRQASHHQTSVINPKP